jgi:hypothetical protein
VTTTPDQPISDPLAPTPVTPAPYPYPAPTQAPVAAPAAPASTETAPTDTPTAQTDTSSPAPVAVGDVVRVESFNEAGRDVGYWAIVVELLSQPDDADTDVALARVCRLDAPGVALASNCVPVR